MSVGLFDTARVTMDVLVVAAHPDDEVLGVGGTVRRHADHGDRVHLLILATGALARETAASQAQTSSAVEALRNAARDAAAILGAEPPRFADFPDNRMDTVALLEVVKTVEGVIAEVAPRLIYTHHPGDRNVDHRLAADAVLTAARPLPDSPVEGIVAFETVSSTEWAAPGAAFVPARFVDVTNTLEAKMAALGAYRSEMRAFPHPRSMANVRALAALRGASTGFAAAEAFAVLRERC